MGHPDRRAKRQKKRETMLRTRNEYDKKDLTPHNCVGKMLDADYTIKYK